MTATNMCSNFVGFRYSPALTFSHKSKLRTKQTGHSPLCCKNVQLLNKLRLNIAGTHQRDYSVDNFYPFLYFK